MNYSVTVSDSVLRSMTMAALEAYILGDGRRGKTRLETSGLLWGYVRQREDATHIHVEQTSILLSSRRHQDWVDFNPVATKLKNSVMAEWAPHLSLLGDFHTHPYESRQDHVFNQGAKFSDADIESVLNDDYLWEESNNLPLQMIMSVAEVERVRNSEPRRNSRNVIRFNFKQYRIWLTAGVGEIRKGERIFLGNGTRKVFLSVDRFPLSPPERIDLTA